MFEPGIYFDLPEKEYRDDPAISYSGIKTILDSTYQFWYYYINPEKPENESIYKDIGKATHTFFLEPEKFWKDFATEFDESQFPDALKTVNDLKDFAKTNGIYLPSSINKPIIIDLIKEAGFDPLIMDELQQRHRETTEGKTVISPDVMEGIKQAARVLGLYKKISNYLKGGYPEVSLFWRDELTGTPLKCRVDYMKNAASFDYKTFGMRFGQSTDKAVYNAIVNGKYYIQAPLYRQGRRVVANMLKRGEGVVYGDHDPGWLERFAANPDADFVFIFQQSSAPFEVKSIAFEECEFKGGSTYEHYLLGEQQIRWGINLYCYCMETGNWIIEDDAMPLEPSDIPVYAYDMPSVIKKCYRLGIDIDGVKYQPDRIVEELGEPIKGVNDNEHTTESAGAEQCAPSDGSNRQEEPEPDGGGIQVDPAGAHESGEIDPQCDERDTGQQEAT